LQKDPIRSHFLGNERVGPMP